MNSSIRGMYKNNLRNTFVVTAITLLFACCKDGAENTTADQRQEPSVSAEHTDAAIAGLIKEFPEINDTAAFMERLERASNFFVFKGPEQVREQKITYYQKIMLHGTRESFFLIECDWNVGPNSDFPWKRQFLIAENGKLISTFSAWRWELLSIFKGQPPFLLTVSVTGKGNGYHSLYGFLNGKLENLLSGPDSTSIQTYDTHEDLAIYRPNELQTVIKDQNNDQIMDISFQGNMLLIEGRTRDGRWYDNETISGKHITYSPQRPFKIIPVRYIFLYDTATGLFRQKGNYAAWRDSLLR